MISVKVGYSTLAEVYHTGVHFGYVARADYNESGPMVDFIRQRMPGMAIDESEFVNGDWIPGINELLQIPRSDHNNVNGAGKIGKFIFKLI